jgi:hypothetical protein
MAAAERVELARSKVATLFERCIELERIHRHLIYREPFQGALANTFASNAYASLRTANFGFELIRLCALWDPPRADRISLPEIAALIADSTVVRQLKADFDGWYDGDGDMLRGPWNNRRFNRRLRQALCLTGVVIRSDRLMSVRDHRDKFLAHNLTIPARHTPKYGYERKLRLTTFMIANALTTVLEDRAPIMRTRRTFAVDTRMNFGMASVGHCRRSTKDLIRSQLRTCTTLVERQKGTFGSDRKADVHTFLIEP